MQANPDGTPTGTGNVTAMFSRGYIEVLFKTADTPLGREFDLALAGHAGVHLAAFSVADAEGAHRRLTEAGFAMRPLVQFQRPVETVTGPDVAAFTVVRLERGAMAEGRIQILAHRTEDTVWQPRWLTHRNGALGLIDLVVVVRRRGGSRGPFRAVHRSQGQADGVRAGASRSTAARCNLFSATHSRRCFRKSRCRGCRSWAPMRCGCDRSRGRSLLRADVAEGRPPPLGTKQRNGQAIALDRGQVNCCQRMHSPRCFRKFAIPRLPFMGAYAVRVQSLATVEALLKQEQMPMRRLGAALVVPFPDELGAGAWLFVENAGDLPWRS